MAASTHQWDRRHLLGLEGLSASDILELLDRAEWYREAADNRIARPQVLSGKTIANLFLEDSTRTRVSFTLAAWRLGGSTIDFTYAGSSLSKGETIVDTALNLHAMGVDGFVIRVSTAGGPHLVALALPPGIPVINAGDGRHEHPTQGLLDIMTLKQRLGDLTGRTIAIVGDVASSRVARSALHGFITLGVNVRLIGPPTLVSKSFEKIAAGPGKTIVSHDLDEALPELDAIMMLRVQFERQGDGPPAISGDYCQLYGLTPERAAKLPAHAVVMHPGPMNRGLEIDSEVADDPKRSVILQQVTNGVAVRMAVMARLLANAE